MSLLNPVDHFNFYTKFEEIFDGTRNYYLNSPTTAVHVLAPNETLWEVRPDGFIISHEPMADMPKGAVITKFMLYTHIQFKGEWTSALAFVQFQIIKEKIPYIRVSSDYFNVIQKNDRYGTKQTIIKPWKKDEIKQDHGKFVILEMPKFRDFDIVPNNKSWQPVVDGCYNLYSKFAHTPDSETIIPADIPVSYNLMQHVFGASVEVGLKYMKVLYEYPKQILPILTLVSKERSTGKTTFINWIQMIFGENSILISPDELGSNFNSMYANKNIILIDETVIEKSASMERLKSITTAKSITVKTKFVQEYSVPFFGKAILCTNKEKDFMRIDDQEIRFWVRKLNPITTINTAIEDDLFKEIPKFLKFLEQQPAPDFTKSRMVLTPEETTTTELLAIKEESKSQLHKELEILVEDFFDNSTLNEFEATVTDIKKRWFYSNNQISVAYLVKVLKDEMGMRPEINRYIPFGNFDTPTKIVGKTYKFTRKGVAMPSETSTDPLLANQNIEDPF